ncbi:MAG: hypothetical protein IJU79_02155 [Desulfovibrionaceae bacterium]|nr:hypothetical protein [Desulfovibrionaceae bacterium]
MYRLDFCDLIDTLMKGTTVRFEDDILVSINDNGHKDIRCPKCGNHKVFYGIEVEYNIAISVVDETDCLLSKRLEKREKNIIYRCPYCNGQGTSTNYPKQYKKRGNYA